MRQRAGRGTRVARVGMATVLTLGIAVSLWFASPNFLDSPGTGSIAWGYGYGYGYGGGGGIPSTPALPPGTTSLTGRVDEEGVFLQDVAAVSVDGLVQVWVPEGTTGRTANGYRLSQITIVEMETPPQAPVGGNIIGLAYELGPDGAIFDSLVGQPVTVTFTFDPTQLPEGVDASELKLAVWNSVSGKWVELPTVVDTDANTVTAQINGFSIYAVAYLPDPATFAVSRLLVTPSTVEGGGVVRITATVSNSGDLEGTYSVELKVDGQVVETQEVTLGGGESTEVSFTTTSFVIGRHTVSVSGRSGSFTVAAKEEPVDTTEPDEPEIEAPVERPDIVASNLNIAPVQVQVGETVVVSVLVINRGDVEGTHEVEVRLAGSVVDSKTVTLAAGATRTVTFQLEPDTAGTFDVEIDSLSKSLRVREILVPEEEGVNPLLIGGIIAVCAVITAVVVVFMIRRRREGF